MPADRRNKICEAANCDTLKPVYTWPQDPQQAEAWTRFVRKKVIWVLMWQFFCEKLLKESVFVAL